MRRGPSARLAAQELYFEWQFHVVFIVLAAYCVWYSLALSGVFVGPSQERLIDWGTSMGEWRGEFDREYSTFFVCSQRIGMHPKWAGKVEYSPEVDAVVVLDWDLLSDAREASALRTYLAAGKPVLLMRDKETSIPEDRTILDTLLGPNRAPRAEDADLTTWSNNTSTVLVFTNKAILNRTSMGKVDAIPTADQMKSYSAAFAVLESLQGSNGPR